MIHTNGNMTECLITGSPEDWQVLWTCHERNETVIGMTEKMKEQLCWCYAYIARFPPDSDTRFPQGLEWFERANPFTKLIYIMVHRRLNAKPDSEPYPFSYYTWTVPFSLGQMFKGKTLNIRLRSTSCKKVKILMLMTPC